jgi:hypothetical protein
MMDYDDFNSQHSLRAQQTVIRELVDLTGFNEERGSRLVDSFNNMHLWYRNKELGVAKSTLMSGHRGTTFLNSVLNAAYIRYFCGELSWRLSESIHVGDDVYMSVPTSAELVNVIGRMSASSCRMNPAKQSVGYVGYEFLRVATGVEGAFGYLSRCVSACVSGNWVGELKLQPLEGLQTIVTHARTLVNRSRVLDISDVLIPSAHRMTGLPKKVLGNILSGRYSFNGSPVFGKCSRRVEYTIEETRKELRKQAAVPSNATDQYLSERASDIERYALTSLKSTVKPAMLRASYDKTLGGVESVATSLKVARVSLYHVWGAVSVNDALHTQGIEGCLTKYPLLNLLRGELRGPLLRKLIYYAGGDSGADDPRREAWGAHTGGGVIDGWLSYADASLLTQRVDAGVVYTVFPYYV